MIEISKKELIDYLQNLPKEDNNFLLSNVTTLNLKDNTGIVYKFTTTDSLERVNTNNAIAIDYKKDKVSLFINEDNKTLSIKKGTGTSYLETVYEDSSSLDCPFFNKFFIKSKELLLKSLNSQELEHKNKKAIEAEKVKEKNQVSDIAKEVNQNKVSFLDIDIPEISNKAASRGFELSAGFKPVMLVGPQGCGKTFAVNEFVDKLEKELGLPVSYYHKKLTKEMDRSDIVGMPSLKENDYTYEIMSKIFFSAREGNLTVGFFDELLRTKDTSPFFNLSDEDYYTLNTGRQLDMVQLKVDDDKNMWFQLTNNKVKQNVAFEDKKINMYVDEYKHLLNNEIEQKVEDAAAYGNIPKITYKEFEKYNLEDITLRSFNTVEIVKAPVKNMLIVAAANIGQNYVQNYDLGEDKAFDSRFRIVQLKGPTPNDLVRKFQSILESKAENGLLKWNEQIDKSKMIDSYSENLKSFLRQIKKLESQKKLNTRDNISYRTIEVLANDISRYKKPDSNTLKECLDEQMYSILDTRKDGNSLVVNEVHKELYSATLDLCISGEVNNKPDKEEKKVSMFSDVSAIKSTTSPSSEEEEEMTFTMGS